MEAPASSEVFLFEAFPRPARRSLLRRGENGAFTSQAPDYRLKQSYDIVAGDGLRPARGDTNAHDQGSRGKRRVRRNPG
jgi:hypothetical protein